MPVVCHNRECFPVNASSDGASGFAWLGLSLNTNFYPAYLYRNRAGTLQKQRNAQDVLYCPTDQWHRFAEADQTAVKNTIDIGTQAGGWTVFFRPADLGPGPY